MIIRSSEGETRNGSRYDGLLGRWHTVALACEDRLRGNPSGSPRALAQRPTVTPGRQGVGCATTMVLRRSAIAPAPARGLNEGVWLVRPDRPRHFIPFSGAWRWPVSNSHPGPGLRGRRTECAALDQLLAEARAGQSRVLVLRGEAGVGKTALLGYVREQASGFRVARA